MIKSGILGIVGCLVLGAASSAGGIEVSGALSRAIVGSRFEYTVKKGDFLGSIAARYGEPASDIARENQMGARGQIFPGQNIVINNLHAVPEKLENGIIINLPQRMLFFFRDGALVAAYPVGLGRPTWETREGSFSVVELRENPTWTVPTSIQEEMRREGELVRTKVPPGPENPLGKYWIGLSLPGYGIHSTNAPSSVYLFRSHGCIRLHPDDAEALFHQIRLKELGKIIYEPVILAALDDGRIFLEVNPDIYHRGANALDIVNELAEKNHLTGRIDWEKAKEVIEGQDGLATRIDVQPAGH